MSQLFVSMVELTCFYSLLGLAYLIVLEGAAVFNFAIGQYAMLSGLAAGWLIVHHDMSAVPAAARGGAGAGGGSTLTELIVVRPIQNRTNREEMPALVAIVAAMAALEQAAGTLFGRSTLPGRLLVSVDPISIGQTIIPAHVVILVPATLVVWLGVGSWRQRSRIGRTLRAVGDNEHASRLLGLPVGRIRVVAFALAGLTAGIAGVLFAPKAGVSFRSGLSWTLLGFLVLVLGGTGSILAPLVGALILAAIEVWVPYYFGSAWSDYVLCAVALVFFAVRPVGIFARRVRA